MTQGHDLPVWEVIPALKDALAAGRAAVLEAPPGAGKTTLAPLALYEEPWLAGKRIVMLEPRRIAARAAAHRMANLIGQKVGQTVGYRVRHEARVGPATRIEVVTEALLTRRLQHDPGLEGIGLVVFDEFHERSLDADLGLALALETQAVLRPDLRILVMSATLDGERVAALLGGASIVRSEGRLYPVETVHVPTETRDIAPAVARVIRQALRDQAGGVLAFLPGEGEIRSTERALNEGALPTGSVVTPLYGNLPFEQQAAAVGPAAPGTRKIVLATAIAETSLTIPDIRVVVDSGLARRPRFEPLSGMTRLVTARLSLASADQRRGRAGRVAAGVCYRLWSVEAERALELFTAPEIASADLAPLALDLAAWGNSDPAGYAFLDPPPRAAYAQALQLLRDLEALDFDGRMTPHGRALNRLGLHPRLAHMILRGKAFGCGWTAAAMAGLLSDRDPLRADRERPDCDLGTRLAAFDGDLADGAVDRGVLARARENAAIWARQADIRREAIDLRHAGELLALAYPDRLAQRRGGRGSFRLRSGRGAIMSDRDALSASDFLAVGAVDQGREDARIFLAAPIGRSDIKRLFKEQIVTSENVTWDARSASVVAVRRTQVGALVLDDRRLERPPADAVMTAVLDGIRQIGIGRLPWTEELRQLQARVDFLRRMDGPGSSLPDLSDPSLTAAMATWLAPYLEGVTRADQFGKINLGSALSALIGWTGQRRVDSEAPTHIEVPTGNRIKLDYGDGEPVLAVRLQELFGLKNTPTVANGRVTVMLHLLSPGRRPVQVTRDLAGFWARSYQDVRKDLKGRYPKHRWPDDPLGAAPTARAKRPGEQE